MPHSGWVQTRPCRQHLWPRGQFLSCRHRRRHLAARSPSAAGGQRPGHAGTCTDRKGLGAQGTPPGSGSCPACRGELLTELLPHWTAAQSPASHCPWEGHGDR